MCSFTLRRWIIPFLSILVVQVGTMKCFYCPQKDASAVLWDLLSCDDQIFLRDKYPDAGQGAVCDLCVRSARPGVFFSRHSSSTSLSAPPISGFWAAGAFGSSRGVLPEPCAHRARTVRAPCVFLRILCPPDPQCLNLSCPGLSPDCLCTTTAPTGIGCRPLSLTLLQEVGVASLFGTNWVVKRSCTSMHPRSGWSLQL